MRLRLGLLSLVQGFRTISGIAISSKQRKEPVESGKVILIGNRLSTRVGGARVTVGR